MSAGDQSLVRGEELVDSAPPSPLTQALPSAPAVSPLTRDFLAWLAGAPRTYAEAMAAWRTSCPRLTIWEDALDDDLVQIETGSGNRMGQAKVTLTARGRAVLNGSLIP